MMLIRKVLGSLTFSIVVLAPLGAAAAEIESEAATPDSQHSQPTFVSQTQIDAPWDYLPYRVLVWLSVDDPTITVRSIERRLRSYLDRDFSSVWRVDIADTPREVRTLAIRNIEHLDYEAVTASDPVLAIKRNHPDAVRIRTVANVAQYCQSVLTTPKLFDQVTQRAESSGDPTLQAVANRLQIGGEDQSVVRQSWSDPKSEALLISRGMARSLDDPGATLISPPIQGLVADTIDAYDKVFIVHVRRHSLPFSVTAVEIDSLMRHFGPACTEYYSAAGDITAAIGRSVTNAFAPVVRIENAGARNATGLLRAGGLIVDKSSPASVGVNDVLEPMIRKNDRRGKPSAIGPIEWALLLSTEIQDRYLKLDFHAGRSDTLQGRKNKRTFRMALKARPQTESTLLRLHMKRNPTFPLIGYELYERELKSRKMTFVGRTNWNGQLKIAKTNSPMRLLYVKNGGAVLAKLPLVPGLYLNAVADLSGDDQRLHAEAYIRGVQNDITDMVAMRKLYSVRIEKKLREGSINAAESLMQSLRKQPTSEEWLAILGRRQVEFLDLIGNQNIGQRRKVDEMFATTRELLSKHITPKLMRDLEALMKRARDNGGKLPEAEEGSTPDDAVDS